MRVNSIVLTSAVLCSVAVVPVTAQASEALSNSEVTRLASRTEASTKGVGTGVLTGEVYSSSVISVETLLIASDRAPLRPAARRWKGRLSSMAPVIPADSNATAGQLSWPPHLNADAAQPQPPLTHLTRDLDGPSFSRKKPTGLASSHNLDSFLAAAERVLTENEASSLRSPAASSTVELSRDSGRMLEAPVIVQLVDPQAVLAGLLTGSETAVTETAVTETAVTETVERDTELGAVENDATLVSSITPSDGATEQEPSVVSVIEAVETAPVEKPAAAEPVEVAAVEEAAIEEPLPPERENIQAAQVVESQDIIIAQSLPALEDVQQIQQQLRTLGSEEEVSSGTRRRAFPNISIANPTGYGADRGEVFAGAGFQSRTRFSGGNLFGGGRPDGAVGIGFGIGDARESVGFQISYTAASFGGSRTPFSGGINAKLHKQFGNGSAAAIGGEGIINFGRLPRPRRNGRPAFNDFEGTYYGVFTHTFALRDYEQPLSRLSLTGGLGSGRFRSSEQIVNGEFDIGVFGSAALQVHPSTNVIAEWTGQDLGLGLSVAPFPNFPIVFTPAVRDLVGEGDGSPRFIFGVGMSLTDAIKALGL